MLVLPLTRLLVGQIRVDLMSIVYLSMAFVAVNICTNIVDLIRNIILW